MDANPTLDQLQVFLAVAETGSFSAAARALNRAQSVVSYTIANLEAQLEVQLFERGGSRQSKLTEAGKAMLTDARRIIADLEAMRARAKSIKQGVEAEISLATSVMVPSEAVVASLRAFREKFPAVSLKLTVGELGMVVDLVLSGKADVGLSGSLLKQDDRITAEKIGRSFMVPVAAVDHPLGRIKRPLTIADVREEVQIVVTDTSGITRGRNFNVLSYKTWHVGDLATKYQLVRGGLGWGGLPAALVKKDIAKGKLVPLKLDAYEGGEYPLYVLRRSANPPGPAAGWLIEAFRQKLSACPDEAPAYVAGKRMPVSVGCS
ncbi:LysR family transcriptional regulator [Chelativorans sp. SCAU2101]|uniref:LysR family transcriptional regulator n=1 Tax=Chelativorans petroleitrophicus TaxID=2975484 RepID=A0A9X2X5D0_9HYPH|nr:LysR family transcriptional regulator [Chelativorans petroleitrophicus]MCT8989080.1 LysR family transcriptional regulator [Chelativorans petroleitrophicus]